MKRPASPGHTPSSAMASFRILRLVFYRVSWLIFIAGAVFLWITWGKHPDKPGIEIQRPAEWVDFQEQMRLDGYRHEGHIRHDEIWQRDEIIQEEGWQQLPGEREVHVYSAYYDDRVTFPVVRVMSVVNEVKNSSEYPLYCVLTFDKIPTTQIVQATMMRISYGGKVRGKAFKQYVMSCQLKSMRPPANVSIVHQPDQAPIIQLPVQVPHKPDERMNFMVCTSGSYGSTPPHKLIEWIEYLRMFGVDHVTIYNGSIVPETMNVFQYYAKHNIVDIRQTHHRMNDSNIGTFWLHNTPLLNDCIYRNMHKYHKIIVSDLDEFVVPRTNDTYLEMLDTIQHLTCGEKLTRNYVFRNAFFFLDLPGPDLNQSSHLVTMQHRRRLPPSRQGWWVKSFIDPRACTNMHNHICWGVLPIYDKRSVVCHVPVELAMLHHYKPCDFDWKARPGKCESEMRNATTDDFMLKFRDKITARMKPIIEDLNLEPL